MSNDFKDNGLAVVWARYYSRVEDSVWLDLIMEFWALYGDWDWDWDRDRAMVLPLVDTHSP